MEYYDEEILESRREEERRRHTALETGIYVEDDLITFTQVTIPDTSMRIFLPEQFISMPDAVRDAKYSSINALDFIVISLDSTVNFGSGCINLQGVL